MKMSIQWLPLRSSFIPTLDQTQFMQILLLIGFLPIETFSSAAFIDKVQLTGTRNNISNLIDKPSPNHTISPPDYLPSSSATSLDLQLNDSDSILPTARPPTKAMKDPPSGYMLIIVLSGMCCMAIFFTAYGLFSRAEAMKDDIDCDLDMENAMFEVITEYQAGLQSTERS